MCIVMTAGVSYFDLTLIGVYLAIASVYLCVASVYILRLASVYLRLASVYLRVRKCIFTHSQVYIHAFASVYSRIR